MVSSTPQPHFTPRKDPVPILQEAWWAPGPVWTGRKSRPHRDSIQDRPARSQSLYRLSYRAHTSELVHAVNIQVKVSEKKVDRQNPAGAINVQEPTARQNALSYFLVGQPFKLTWEVHKHF